MQRFLLIVLIGLVLVLFAWSNAHHVEVGLILGRPVHVRLIFLLLTTFLVGHFTAVLMNMYLRAKMKSKGARKEPMETVDGDEDDDFFLE